MKNLHPYKWVLWGQQKHEAWAAIIPVNWRSLETNEYRKYRNICCWSCLAWIQNSSLSSELMLDVGAPVQPSTKSTTVVYLVGLEVHTLGAAAAIRRALRRVRQLRAPRCEQDRKKIRWERVIRITRFRIFFWYSTLGHCCRPRIVRRCDLSAVKKSDLPW